MLFDQVSFTLNKGDKTALVGENGSGKSTLLHSIFHQLEPISGEILHTVELKMDIVPQHFGQYDAMPVKEALGFGKKLDALHHILAGRTEEEYFNDLQDDWEIENRIQLAFAQWKIDHIAPDDIFATLSGGEKTRAFLAKTAIFPADLILLDEPSNHLDRHGRTALYQWIQDHRQTLLMVSHDRELLELCGQIVEISPLGSKVYGGNYSFYLERKEEENAALRHKIQHAENTLAQEKKKNQALLQARQRQQVKGQQKHQKRGTDKIQKNALREKSEQSASKLRKKIAAGQQQDQQSLQALRQQQQKDKLLSLDMGESQLHEGKCLLRLEKANASYDVRRVFREPISLEIFSGDRLAIEGNNGSGKSTLLRLLSGELPRSEGHRYSADFKSVQVDQDYSLIDRQKTVYEQIQAFNQHQLLEHELKVRLNRFLFDVDFWDKPCAQLSGGELLRLALCSIMVFDQTPDLIILDEPTNNLDLKNIEILSQTMQSYRGTLLVVSHDRFFKEEIGINRTISLPQA
jgi:ATPase subunit of ABC transporter with duplicated ATPase domains